MKTCEAKYLTCQKLKLPDIYIMELLENLHHRFVLPHTLDRLKPIYGITDGEKDFLEPNNSTSSDRRRQEPWKKWSWPKAYWVTRQYAQHAHYSWLKTYVKILFFHFFLINSVTRFVIVIVATSIVVLAAIFITVNLLLLMLLCLNLICFYNLCFQLTYIYNMVYFRMYAPIPIHSGIPLHIYYAILVRWWH